MKEGWITDKPRYNKLGPGKIAAGCEIDGNKFGAAQSLQLFKDFLHLQGKNPQNTATMFIIF